MKIILFDGDCNLCNSSVQFVIKHDRKDIFRFVALQSKLGKQILEEIEIQKNTVDSFILYESKIKYYIKSSAAIEVAKNLGGIFYLMVFFKIIPTKIRDLIYDYVARNRYRWFGKNNTCIVPTPEISAKFLS